MATLPPQVLEEEAFAVPTAYFPGDASAAEDCYRDGVTSPPWTAWEEAPRFLSPGELSRGLQAASFGGSGRYPCHLLLQEEGLAQVHRLLFLLGPSGEARAVLQAGPGEGMTVAALRKALTPPSPGGSLTVKLPGAAGSWGVTSLLLCRGSLLLVVEEERAAVVAPPLPPDCYR